MYAGYINPHATPLLPLLPPSRYFLWVRSTSPDQPLRTAKKNLCSRKMVNHSQQEASNIDAFIHVRKMLLQWTAAKRDAMTIADLHFPKTHPLRKCLANLCAGEVLGDFRYQADNAACLYADAYGDELFHIEIDGVKLQSPVDLVYGPTLCECEQRTEIKIASGVSLGKQLSLIEITRLRDLANCAMLFMTAVKQLPNGSRPNSALGRRLVQCENRFQRLFSKFTAKLRDVKVDHRMTHAVLLCLHRKGLPSDVHLKIVSFLL